MERHEQPNQNVFEINKRKFFTKLGIRAREWLATHRDLGGLWDGPKYTTQDGNKKEQRWENVSEHCLVEGARVEILSDLLKLSPEAKKKLFAAAILHDFNKKDEVINTALAGRVPESFEEESDKGAEKLEKTEIDKDIIEISGSVAHWTTSEMENILTKAEIDEHDISRLVMHYVDDYTLNTEWVEKYDGAQNDLDRRIEANENNPKYSKIAALGLYREQARVGKLVEKKLAELIKERSQINISPELLPEYIDEKIKEAIGNSAI